MSGVMLERSSGARQGLGIAAIGLALYAQHQVRMDPHGASGWLLFGVAAVLIAASARAGAPQVSPGAARSSERVPRLQRVLCWSGALLAVAATTAISQADKVPVLTILLWFAGFAFASLAVRGSAASPSGRADQPWARWEVGALAAVLVLAAAARTLWLDSLPRAIFGDEPRVGMYLVNAYRERIPNFFSMGWNTWPVIGLSLQGVFAPVLGLKILALRASSALMGTLAVLTTYLLARELFNARLALLAALLFAICRTAIDFSRMGVCHAQVLFYQTFAFFFWWRALNTGRALHYLWAGIGVGLCMYTYNAGQLVPPMLIGWIVLSAVLAPRLLRTHWRGALLVAAGFLLALLPYLFYITDVFAFRHNWDQFTIMARNRNTVNQLMSAWQAGGLSAAVHVLGRQAGITWLGFGVLPGAGYATGYRGGGMLNEVTAPLFVLGLAMAIAWLRRPRVAFLAYWWIATVIAGGILTIDPPSVVRMVGILPALAILAALPLDWLMRSGGVRSQQAVGVGLAAVLLAGAAWDNWQTYFKIFAAEPADENSELARYIETLPAETNAVLLGSEHFLHFHQEMFLLEFPGRLRDVPDPAHYFPVHEAVETPLATVLGPTQLTLIDYIRSLYPDFRLTEVRLRDGRPLFRALEFDPEVIRRRAGLTRTSEERDGGAPRVQTADPFAAESGAGAPAGHVVWKGGVYWPTDRRVVLTAEASVPTRITLAGMVLMQPDGERAVRQEIQLPRGWQPLWIDERVVGPRRLSMTIEQNRAARPLTRWDLRPESTEEGLRATYTQAGAVLRAIDPQVDAFAVEDRFQHPNLTMVRMPFSASWQGALRVDTEGAYEFEARGSGPYSVRLDGAVLFEVASVVPENPAASRATRKLSPGLHPIAIEWDSTKPAHTTRRLFQLYWTPPGGAQELIPPTHFVPLARQ